MGVYRHHLLLFRMGGLGDLMVAYPAIYFLRRILSPCFISLVCRLEYGRLLRQTGIVDELISVDSSWIAPLFNKALTPNQEFLTWLENFDLITGWFQSKSDLLLDRFLSISENKVVHFIEADQSLQEPLSFYFFRKTAEIFARKEEMPAFSDYLFLPFNQKHREEGRKLLGNNDFWERNKPVVIHPGSGSQKKCWPLENFLNLINQLDEKGVKGVVVTGMSEAWMEDKLKSFNWPRHWLWIHHPSLIKLAGLLAQSFFYVGNDSGITHLAAVCRTKGLAFFRQELVKLWQPAGPIITLSASSLNIIKLEEVWIKIKKWI